MRQQLGVAARIYDEEDGCVKTQCLAVQRVERSTAEAIFESIESVVTKDSIPWERLVGTSTDGCNVMRGKHNSVLTRLVRAQPDLFSIHCVCHAVHLCASDACSQLSDHLEEFLRLLVYFFEKSAKRTAMFEEYQELAGVSVHKLIKPSQTRWLSLAEGVSRVLEQWDALLYYFQTCSDVKSLQKVRRFVSIMEQPMTKAHLFFLEEALTIFTDFNKRYQSSDVMIHCLHDDQLDLFRLLALNFMKPPAVKALPGTDIVSLDLVDASLYLADEDLVISKKAEEAASKLTPEEREIFYDSCRRFYWKGAEKVKCRLRLRDPVLMGVRMLSPADGTSMTAMSVSNLAERFPQVILPNELLGLQREWQRYQAASATTCALAERTGGAVDRYWSAIGLLKDGTSARFPLLFRLAKALLVLPHSSADIERHFSALDSEMCATRNTMGLPLLNSLLTITCNRGETTC